MTRREEGVVGALKYLEGCLYSFKATGLPREVTSGVQAGTLTDVRGSVTDPALGCVFLACYKLAAHRAGFERKNDGAFVVADWDEFAKLVAVAHLATPSHPEHSKATLPVDVARLAGQTVVVNVGGFEQTVVSFPLLSTFFRVDGGPSDHDSVGGVIHPVIWARAAEAVATETEEMASRN